MAGNISTQTTVLSNLSVERNLSVGTLLGSPAATLGAVTATTVAATTSVTVGGGTAVTRLSKGTFSVVTMTCTANGSTTTDATVAPLNTSDVIILNPPSSMSSGINLTGFVSGNSTVRLIFSNCSTAAQVVAGPFTVSYAAIRS